MYGAEYFKLVTLKIPGIAGGGNTGVQFQFQDQSDIRYARITGLEVYFASDLQYSQPEPVAVLADAEACKVSITLETNDPDDIAKLKGANGRFNSTSQTTRWMPLTALHRLQNQATNNASFARQLMQYKDLYVVWEKCFINIAPGGLANTTDVGIVLGVYYSFLNSQGQEIKRT